MKTCPRCGGPLASKPGAPRTPEEAGKEVCPRCSAETIHAAGEVIPPGAAGEPGSPGPRTKFALAFTIALAADIFQLVLFPLFLRGFLSPLDDLLDIAVGFAMVRLLGWHWAFLPSFMGKLVPILDELPCWTLAVLFVRGKIMASGRR